MYNRAFPVGNALFLFAGKAKSSRLNPLFFADLSDPFSNKGC